MASLPTASSTGTRKTGLLWPSDRRAQPIRYLLTLSSSVNQACLQSAQTRLRTTIVGSLLLVDDARIALLEHFGHCIAMI